MHNVFHQSEHVLCMLQRVLANPREAPQVILWPYRSLAWSHALVSSMLPKARWMETCCGPDNVRARWFEGRRYRCGCWQKVCPVRYQQFWPGMNGSAAHGQIRAHVRKLCGLHPHGGAALASSVVRVLERGQQQSRQIQEVGGLMKAISGAVGDGRRAERVRAEVADPILPLAGGDSNRTAATLLPHLCEQVRWFANARVVVVAHGAATTNAIFADSGALVVDLLPFAYRAEPSAPGEYYEALLANTDVLYRQQRSSRPRDSPQHGMHERHHVKLDEQHCREEKACRVAFRDHSRIALDRAALRELQLTISSHLQHQPSSRGAPGLDFSSQ